MLSFNEFEFFLFEEFKIFLYALKKVLDAQVKKKTIN